MQPSICSHISICGLYWVFPAPWEKLGALPQPEKVHQFWRATTNEWSGCRCYPWVGQIMRLLCIASCGL